MSEKKIVILVWSDRYGGHSVNVVGDTYPFRQTLKALGLRWDDIYRVWTKSSRDIAEIKEYAQNLTATLGDVDVIEADVFTTPGRRKSSALRMIRELL